MQTGDGGPGQCRALGVQVAADDRAGGGSKGLGVDPGAHLHGKGAALPEPAAGAGVEGRRRPRRSARCASRDRCR